MPDSAATFTRLAATHTLIPVVRELFADLETPVSCFWKLAGDADWSFLLESVEGGEQWARYTLMGTSPRAIYTAKADSLTITRPGGPSETRSCTDPLGELVEIMGRQRVYRDPDLPRFIGGLVGGLTYDAVRWMERLPDRHEVGDAPDLVFMASELTLVWDNLKHRAMLVYLAHVPEPSVAAAAWAAAQTALDAAQARLDAPLPALPTVPADSLSSEPVVSMSDRAFGRAVVEAKKLITAGDVIQVVLSRAFRQPANVHPFLVYRTLRSLNPSPYMFYLRLGEQTLVGASPEVLVRVTDGLVESRPIAGTRPRGADPAADEALAVELLADPKEVAEHVMLVDLARNDVGRVARSGSVAVTQQMIIERYSHVMHIVSHVHGQARPDASSRDIVAATFPAGTLSGAPKIRAMQIIDAFEPERRGMYGGAVGFLGAGGNIDLCIAIRMLVSSGGSFRVQAGAGIVYDSDPVKEAEETRDKAMAVLRAIDLAREHFREVAP